MWLELHLWLLFHSEAVTIAVIDLGRASYQGYVNHLIDQ